MEGLGGNRRRGRGGISLQHICGHSGAVAGLEQEAKAMGMGQDGKESLKWRSVALAPMVQCAPEAREKGQALGAGDDLIPPRLPCSSLV
jgi:hypothetical protein